MYWWCCNWIYFKHQFSRGERERLFGFRNREGKLKIIFPFYGKGTGIRKCYGKGREWEIWGLYSRKSLSHTLLLTGKKGNPKLNWVNYFRKFSTCTKKCNSKLHECVVWLLRVDWDLWWFYIVKWIFWTGAFFVVGGFWSEDVFPSEGRSGPRISGTGFFLETFGTLRSCFGLLEIKKKKL